jgi:hypothetical protein
MHTTVGLTASTGTDVLHTTHFAVLMETAWNHAALTERRSTGRAKILMCALNTNRNATQTSLGTVRTEKTLACAAAGSNALQAKTISAFGTENK